PYVPQRPLYILFHFHQPTPIHHLHSFPTRRSSDLTSGPRSSRRTRSAKAHKSPTSGTHCTNTASASISLTTPSAGPTKVTTPPPDRKSTRLNSSHVSISYAVFCLKKTKK